MLTSPRRVVLKKLYFIIKEEKENPEKANSKASTILSKNEKRNVSNQKSITQVVPIL